jgi:hypothetical protein
VSYQMTLARAEAAHFEAIGTRQQAACPVCESAARRRHLDKACPDGAELLAGRRSARAALEREIAAEAAPIPGQCTLFDLECP